MLAQPRRLPSDARVKRLTNTTLPEAAAERVRQEHHRAIEELQALPCVTLRVIRDVELEDGKPKPVPHGLGRPALWVRESCPRGASTTGRVTEVRTGSGDRKHVVVLQADGWGATITVDVLVA